MLGYGLDRTGSRWGQVAGTCVCRDTCSLFIIADYNVWFVVGDSSVSLYLLISKIWLLIIIIIIIMIIITNISLCFTEFLTCLFIYFFLFLFFCAIDKLQVQCAHYVQ